MAVFAVTTIRHGNDDGEVVVKNVGDEVDDLGDDVVLELLSAGAAVEIGENRKFTVAPSVGNADEDTLKRDVLLSKAATGDSLFTSVALGISQGTIPTDTEAAEKRAKEAGQFNRRVGAGDDNVVTVPTDQLLRHQTQENADRLNKTAQASAETETNAEATTTPTRTTRTTRGS